METQIVDRVSVYKRDGEWCYSAWMGDEFDHSDTVDVLDEASAADVTRELKKQFPRADVWLDAQVFEQDGSA